MLRQTATVEKKSDFDQPSPPQWTSAGACQYGSETIAAIARRRKRPSCTRGSVKRSAVCSGVARSRPICSSAASKAPPSSTLASQKPSHTLNSTASAAHALWHFAQTFFFEFPHYKPNDDRVSLWAESYGGHYGPGFMRFFQEQNEKIRNGTSEVESAQYIHLDTLGIVNGLLDAVIQEEAYISFPFNNVSPFV